MARRKTSDKKGTGKESRAANRELNLPNVQADHDSIAIGGINIGRDLSGNLTIGYTANQVSEILTKISSKYQLKPFDERCPYKGLDVFEEEDAELFFGRERLVNELVGRVKESRTVFITGPSGSGKSSLVRAGLIYALKQGKIKSSERWLYETMKPGREPIKDLALAFSRLKSPELEDYFLEHAGETDILNKCAESVLSGRRDQRFLLFIDQFEEVFTQINQEEERIAFINMLAQAGTVENGRVILLFAMRSDFVSNCATYPALNELLSQEFRQIGAMQPEELVSAIALPARHVGLPIEDELIARIINDMKGEPGALPLMQFALKDLFDSQQEMGGVIALTLRDYLQHGGIHKSLERHADATFAKLDQNEQELTRSIFSGLIEIGRGTQDTKRTALFDELVPAHTKAEEVQAIVGKLADARLIITDEQAGKDTVTISHEKLIEAWPWLKKLVNENRDVIALQNEIASDAKEWEENKRDTSYLYTGARLANSLEQLQAKKLVLSDIANQFVQAGRTQQELGRRTQQRRIVVLWIATVMALVIMSVLAYMATQQRSIAQEQLNIALARQLAAQSLFHLNDDLNLSLLLSVQSYLIADTREAQSSMLGSLVHNSLLEAFLHGHKSSVMRVAFSADSQILASGDNNGTIILWDVSNPKIPIQLSSLLTTAINGIQDIVISPDIQLLASVDSSGVIILWDISNPKSPIQIGTPLTGYGNTALNFGGDGKTLVSVDLDGTTTLWDISNPTEPIRISQTMLIPMDSFLGSFENISFSPDDRLMGYISGMIRQWDLSNPGEPIYYASVEVGGTQGQQQAVMSPTNELAASASEGGIYLWNVSDPEVPVVLSALPTNTEGHFIPSLAFSPDGPTLVTNSCGELDNINLACVYGQITLWDISDSTDPVQLGKPFIVDPDERISFSFSPNGRTLAIAGVDETIILWNVENPKDTVPLGRTMRGFLSETLNSEGNLLASSTIENEIILWDVSNPNAPVELSISVPSSQMKYIESMVFSPDSKALATAHNDGMILLWDVSDPKKPVQLTKLLCSSQEATYTVDWSSKAVLAAGCHDGTAILWDVSNPKQPIRLKTLTDQADAIISIIFSPDGNELASGSWDDTIILWDVSNPNTPIRLSQILSNHSGEISSLAFSPDSNELASGSWDNTVILWDISNPKSPAQFGLPLSGHSNLVWSVVFSPDGKRLASGSSDQTIILWDVSNPKAPAQLGVLPLPGSSKFVTTTDFSADGKMLVSNSARTIFWNVDPNAWLARACQLAGRNLTRAEWQQHLPNQEYRKTCEQWPLEPETTTTPRPMP